MARNSGVNKRAVAQLMNGLQREFDKHKITVPIEATGPGVVAGPTAVYNGPMITVNGDHAQIAWGNNEVTQTQTSQDQVAPGFEQVAVALVNILRDLNGVDLSAEEREVAEEAAKTTLEEITKEQPNPGIVRRGIAAVRGVLAPLALGAQAGASEGAKAWAKTAIEQLPSAF